MGRINNKKISLNDSDILLTFSEFIFFEKMILNCENYKEIENILNIIKKFYSIKSIKQKEENETINKYNSIDGII